MSQIGNQDGKIRNYQQRIFMTKIHPKQK
uniref:Uncharacterized protein n=1 Tax=Sciurus vulgaris TaxID=55149 RepID=A0A8D2DSE8_SCIVU